MAIPKDRYSVVAITLHWIIAALILTNIGIAWYFNTLHGTAAIPPVQLHKSVGITVLILSVARVAWRLTTPPPPLPSYVRGWERGLAHATHAGFYLIMLGLPLSGWAMVSASNYIKIYPITLFNLVPWPSISVLTNLPHDQMKAASHLAGAVHGLLAKLAYVLVVLHVAGAAKHQFISRDDVVGRMIPFLRRRAAG